MQRKNHMSHLQCARGNIVSTRHTRKHFGAPVLWWNPADGLAEERTNWEQREYNYLCHLINGTSPTIALQALDSFATDEIQSRRFPTEEGSKEIPVEGGTHTLHKNEDIDKTGHEALMNLITKLKEYQVKALRPKKQSAPEGSSGASHNKIVYHTKQASYQNFSETMLALQTCIEHMSLPRMTAAVQKCLSDLLQKLHILSLYMVPVVTGDKNNLLARWSAVRYFAKPGNHQMPHPLHTRYPLLSDTELGDNVVITRMMEKAASTLLERQILEKDDIETVLFNLVIFIEEFAEYPGQVADLDTYESEVREFLLKQFIYAINIDKSIVNKEDEKTDDHKFKKTTRDYVTDINRGELVLSQPQFAHISKRKRDYLSLHNDSAKKFKKDIDALGEVHNAEIKNIIEKFFYLLHVYPQMGIVSPPFDTVEQYEDMKRKDLLPTMSERTAEKIVLAATASIWK